MGVGGWELGRCGGLTSAFVKLKAVLIATLCLPPRHSCELFSFIPEISSLSKYSTCYVVVALLQSGAEKSVGK